MKRELSYLRWRERLSTVTPADHRIGTDLLLVERSDTPLNFPKGPFKCDMSSAIFYASGSARMRINMREFRVEAPCLLIIQKDQIYEPLERSDDVRVKVVIMSKQFLDSLSHDMGEIHAVVGALYKNPVVCTENITRVFNQYYEMLLSITKSQDLKYKEKAAKHLTLSMFYGYFCNKHLNNGSQRKSRQDELFSAFLDLLHLHHKQERQIRFYADKLCITPKYLSRIVKDLTGHTALEYIEDYVITEAKALLGSTTMDIQEIGHELNFPSQSCFGKYFKRIVKISPKEYRNGFISICQDISIS